MNNKHYLGRRVSTFESYDDIGPITGVALIVQGEEEEKEILATNSDTSGYVLEIECPYATQAMADNIFASVVGKTYRGFRATGARFDPAAELGDAITVNGTYSMIAYRRANFGPNHVSEIAAPGENAVQHEYSSGSGSAEIRRLKAETYSQISKNAEAIALRVTGKEAETLFKQTLKDFTLSVSSSNGITSFTLSDGEVSIKADKVSLSVDVANISGKLTADNIEAGAITASHIATGVIPTSTSDLTNDDGWTGYWDVVSIIGDTVTAGYIEARGITAQKLLGGSVGLIPRPNASAVGTLTITDASSADYAVELESNKALRLSASDGSLYAEGGGGEFLELGGGYCHLGGGALVIPGVSYGNTLPGTGTYGQVYFLLE